MRKYIPHFLAAVFMVLFLWQACKKAAPCNEVSSTHTVQDTTPVSKDGKDTSVATLIDSTKPVIKQPRKPVLVPLAITDTSSGAELRRIIDSLKYSNDSLLLANYSLQLDIGQLEISLGTERVYADVIYLDSAERSYVLLKDTVANNILAGRGYEYHWQYDQVNTTTTVTKVQKSRAKVLLGLSVSGTKQDPLKGIGLGLGLQARNNKIYLVGARKIQGIKEPVFEFTYLLPLSLRKK